MKKLLIGIFLSVIANIGFADCPAGHYPGCVDITGGVARFDTVTFNAGGTITLPAGTTATPTGTAGGSLGGTYPNPTVVTNANLTGPIASIGNATSVTSQTGTGTTFVMQTSPTITGTLTSTDLVTTGATPTFDYNVSGGPVLHVRDTTATSAPKSVIGAVAFDANNSGPVQQTQAQISAGMNDNAGGSNDGSIAVSVVSSNVMTNVFTGNSTSGGVLSVNIPANLRVGSATAPTVPLDVTGDAKISGALTTASVTPTANGSGALGAASTGWTKLYVDYTNTATVGNVTINKAAGRVNIAAAGTSITVTNSLVTAASHVFAVMSNADATGRVISVIPSAGSFIINTAAVTAQSSFDFFVINAD